MPSKPSPAEITKLKAKIESARQQRQADREARPFDEVHTHEMHFLIAKHINRARKREGISMAEFARLIEVDKAQLTRWLTGRQNLTVKSIARMQVALKEPVVMVADQAYKSFEERGLRGTPREWIEEKDSERVHFIQPQHQERVMAYSWTSSAQVTELSPAQPPAPTDVSEEIIAG